MKLAVYHTQDDRPYLETFKAFLKGQSVEAFQGQPMTMLAALGSADALITSSPAFIKMLTRKTKCDLEDYYGSYWLRRDAKGREVPILVVPPFKQLHTVKPGVFQARRYLSKLFQPDLWYKPTPFSWSLCDDGVSSSNAYADIARCDYLAVDIETSRAFADPELELDPANIISCCAYSAIFLGSAGSVADIRTYVFPCKTLEGLRWIRKINQLSQGKIFQNGKYDNIYFMRHGCPVQNWCFDTMNMHHAVFAELPKNLGYIAAFYLLEVSYWKDEGKTGDLKDFYTYNAKDAWATANTFCAQILQAPPWGITNYLKSFPLNFPALKCEMDGILVNQAKLGPAREEQKEIQHTALTAIRRKLGRPTFNPGSWQQVLSLLKVLGNKDATNADRKALDKASDKHPIAKRIIDEIIDYRRSSKLISTYLDAELWHGKLLYSISFANTDTGRPNSKESAFWCGTQLQNLPEYFKRTLEAEDGFYFGEGDGEQAESRCVAYLPGDEGLIAAVESERDFHGTNASSFFGVPYSEIVDQNKKVLDKALRDLAKRVNHGSNYNMGEAVLLDTMGAKNVIRAQALLKLPSHWSLKMVCSFLLKKYSDTYPLVKGEFYDYIKSSIKVTHQLVSDLGWVRLCFGNPSKNKMDLNAYAAHVPSNLSVGIINEAFLDIFWNIDRKSNGDFRLKGHIHDSIPFVYREGRLDMVEDAWHRMTRPKLIRDPRGKTRLMTIPIMMKGEAKCWTDIKKLTFTPQ
jgi:hypothetical protein